MPGCAKQKSHKWNCRFFETLEENLEENVPFFIQVMMKQVYTGLLVFKKNKLLLSIQIYFNLAVKFYFFWVV